MTNRRVSAHNLKVVGSNPTPATKNPRKIKCLEPDLISRVLVCAILVNAWSTFEESPHKGADFLRLATSKALWQHRAMIEFRTLSVSHSDRKRRLRPIDFSVAFGRSA